MNVLELMQIGPVIPVIDIERVESTVPLARALVADGVRVLELTLRTLMARPGANEHALKLQPTADARRFNCRLVSFHTHLVSVGAFEYSRI